ncbi:MAG: prepilin-type N-terminal cleavage/methylation domain-containing protein [Nitrospirae bacterium]|nr:prepilin-type N-terminal cleavage/methylation domain-containing protein [Nitrospirota bacterium]
MSIINQKNNKGFTLIELLIVMSIIAILGTIGITAYVGSTLKAARSEAYANLSALQVLESQLVAETGAYATSQGACAADSPGNIALIQTVLPGFQPGQGLQFSYCIEMDIDMTGAGQVPCFRAQAFGNTAGRAAGDVFMIDCNNNKTF